MVKQTSSFALYTVSAVLVAALSSSCGAKKPLDQVVDQPPGLAGPHALATSPTPGLVMRLGSGAPNAGDVAGDAAGAPGAERTPPAQARALPEAQTQRLLARLSALPRDPGADFALPPRSRPAPRPGQEIEQPFPPTRPPTGAVGGPPASDAAKRLAVLRYAPEGEVPLAPHLSVTFSQPMVAVTSQRQAAATIPVKLTPTPAGQWRWVGTQTLLFDPEPRFPQATRYRVEIPAGTRAAGGQPLDKAMSFEFATPPPQLVQSHPAGTSQPRTPRMLAVFDQDVDPAAVLAHVRVHVRAAGQTYPVRLLTPAELAADDALAGMISAAQPRRHVAFTVENLLPADSDVAVEIAPGTPSAEGPRTTEKAQSFSFRTHGPLEVVESRCGWNEQCQPMASWQVRFSNPIDTARFDPAAIRVKPALPGMAAEAMGDLLMIHGQSKARTSYEVTLPAGVPSGLIDVYGQTLGKPKALTFRVGDAEPSFFGPNGLVVLDPAARKPSLSVFTMNTPALDVRLHRVTPADWPAYVRYLQHQHGPDASSIPGTKVVSTQVKVQGVAGELAETAIDLGPALAGKHGHVVAVVEPATWHEQHWKPRTVAWLQVTEIGLDAFADQTELIGWATRLADGAPLADVEIALLGPNEQSGQNSAKTDAGGLARLPLPEQTAPRSDDLASELVVIARRGDDTALLPESPWGGGSGFRRQPTSDSLLWYVFDDRQMYRPGEKVSVKGWIRRLQGQELGDVAGLGEAVEDVSYVLQDPQGDELGRGTAKVDAAGGFQLEIAIPANANLGWAGLQLTSRGRGEVQGRIHHHGLQIQEFRRPAFEVTASAGPGPHLVGESAQVEMKASYYAGGGLAGADVSWRVTSAETTFTPPNRDDFIFGRWRPWWEMFGFGDRWGGPGFGRPATAQELAGKTDAGGVHALGIEFVRVDPPLPMQVTAEATVMDVDRQAWSARANLLVHPAALYVGVKTRTTFVERGTPIELQTIIVDIDGRAVAGRELAVRAERMVWSYQKHELVPDDAGAQECITKSAEQPVACSFATAQGGQYRITARVTDDQGRVSETQMTMWVSGGDTPPARDIEQERVTLIPDQKSYQPGDTARILVQAPFAPAQGVLTLRRSGIAETRRFTMDGSSTTLEVVIEERHIPNVQVQVDLVGAAPRTDDRGRPDEKLPRRPAYALGQLDLSVPPRSRTLAVEVVPAERSLAPGSKTSLEVIVRDAQGQPVAGAAMAVVVVDEAVLALSNYQLADPVEVFYAHRDAGARDYHTRAYVELARPEATNQSPPAPPPAPPEATRQAAPGAAGDMAQDEAEMQFAGGAPMKAARGSAASTEPPIAMRTDFRALALFAPAVSTDARGRAQVPLSLPDSLTRYRVMAVAVSGERFFGKGESTITARKPLMVRPSPPRFLRFGDTFELPVVVQNQTDQPLEVEVAVRAANARFTQGQGRALSVPANQRLELRFPAAAERAGNARIQVVAQAGKATDAAELDVPVWTPVTTEAFATYGQLDGPNDGQSEAAVRQPVVVPAGVVTAYGGLEVTTSSTELASLTDALLYLVAYPFECSEQVASRVLAVAALRDVLAAFAAENLPSASELQAAVGRDIEVLARLQNPDGGFDFWRRGAPSQPYVSLHVAHALARARAKGFTVPDQVYEQARAYVADVERHIPSWYGEQARRAILAYGLYVEKHLGAQASTLPARSAERARQLAGHGLDKLSLEAVGWLLYALSGDAGASTEIAAIHRHLQNRATETAGTAHFATGYGDEAYLLLHSDRRADAVILEALIADQPGSDLIPKVTRGLLAHRTRGRWLNTQENAFVLLALDRYFQTYEKVTPDFVARVWLGDRFAGEQRFRGRQTDRQRIDIPMALLAAQAPAQRAVDLILQKAGAGRLYYRIGMRYAPADLAVPAADYGFTVERTYEHVDAPGDVTRMDDGAWKIRAGARVRVRVRMVAPARRYHVALIDPLPAGLEPLNPALAVSQSVPEDPRAPDGKRPYWSWLMPWYEHQNLRDDRAEAFSTLVWADVHEYSYVARATTPGRFVAPPAQAEEMYFPETFGRSSTDRVIVE
jgi:alpha-2-macroglobulin